MTVLTPDRCSINTATLGYKAPIGQVIDAVARHGFGAIAPWRREIEGSDVCAIARHIRDAGLAVSGYCRSSAIPADTPERRRAQYEENCRAISDAAELGAACFVIVAGGLPTDSRDLDGARTQVEDGLARLLEEARRLRVALAIEPLHPMYAADRCCINTLSQALDICDRLDPDGEGGIGVAIDAYHVWWDPRLRSDIDRAGCSQRIAAFHICDWLVPTTDLLMDRGMIGDGVIDLSSMLRGIAAAGFAGHAEIEIFSNNWWAVESEEVLRSCAERVGAI
ncbi:MAG: Xylose isomerase domain protein barrel [Xanthobacteraceae bacterium]|nr:Xylose isomerase domain protein barrel [Xanthobacteraceae bacterium]